MPNRVRAAREGKWPGCQSRRFTGANATPRMRGTTATPAPTEQDQHHGDTSTTPAPQQQGTPAWPQGWDGGGSTLGGGGPGTTFRENSTEEAVDIPRCRYRHPYVGTWSARQGGKTGSDCRPRSWGPGLRGTRRYALGPPRSGKATFGSSMCDGAGRRP